MKCPSRNFSKRPASHSVRRCCETRGWLIFKTPPAEMGVHPAAGPGGEQWGTVPTHQVSLMCDDIEATAADLRAKGVTVADEVRDEGFGLTTTIEVPGAGSMMLYEPRHDLAYALDT